MSVVLAMLVVKASTAATQSPSLEAARRALAAGDAPTSMAMYEALTQQGESLEAEIGLVRATLLAGEFRKAMSWATLTAGEHKDSAEAVALLAYLHDRVGHTEQALASLEALREAQPSSSIAAAAEAEILTDRLAPAARASDRWPRPAFEKFPVEGKQIAAAGNGLIVDEGTRVLTYSGLLPKGVTTFYVRNGLGKIRRAERTPGDQKGELVRLQLAEAFPASWGFPEEQIIAPEGVKFCFGFGYPAPRRVTGSYPAVAPGLVFRANAGIGGLMQVTSALGAGHSGAPVFDARGRLMGVSVGAGDIAIGGKNLRPLVGKGSFAVRVIPEVATQSKPAGAMPPMPAVEELYERLLPMTVQVIGIRP